MKLYVLLVLSMTITMACSSKHKIDGFHRGALIDQVSEESIVEIEFSDSDIKKALEKKATLPKNFRLAVFFKPPKNKDWRWSGDDKKKIMESLKELQESGPQATVFTLLSSLVDGDDMKSLRLAAAKHGADALLIVDGRAKVERSLRDYGVSYALLLPLFFVNGNSADTLFVASATMWDVRNQYLYLSAESEGTYKINYPAAFPKNDKEVFQKSKDLAIDSLKSNLVAMVKGS